MPIRLRVLLLIPLSLAAAQVDPWAILTRGVAEENITKRTSALNALATLGGKRRAVALVEPALSDKEWSVRQASATALGQMGARSSIPKLQQALQDPVADVAFSAARALWDLGDRSGREIFLEVLTGERSDKPGSVRGAMRDARSKLRRPRSLAVMGLKEGAGFALGPFSMGIGVVEELLKDGGATARALSASLLASDPDPGSLRHLQAALADKNWAVRVAAARALGTQSDQASLPKLEARLEDEKDAVRYMAAASILRLNSRKGTRRASR